jgi:hypothetical protein
VGGSFHLLWQISNDVTHYCTPNGHLGAERCRSCFQDAAFWANFGEALVGLSTFLKLTSDARNPSFVHLYARDSAGSVPAPSRHLASTRPRSHPKRPGPFQFSPVTRHFLIG